MKSTETEKTTEALNGLADMVGSVCTAITARASSGTDAAGGTVTCLTEASMGVTAGLVTIAEAIDGLTEAVRESREKT